MARKPLPRFDLDELARLSHPEKLQYLTALIEALEESSEADARRKKPERQPKSNSGGGAD